MTPPPPPLPFFRLDKGALPTLAILLPTQDAQSTVESTLTESIKSAIPTIRPQPKLRFPIHVFRPTDAKRAPALTAYVLQSNDADRLVILPPIPSTLPPLPGSLGPVNPVTVNMPIKSAFSFLTAMPNVWQSIRTRWFDCNVLDSADGSVSFIKCFKANATDVQGLIIGVTLNIPSGLGAAPMLIDFVNLHILPHLSPETRATMIQSPAVLDVFESYLHVLRASNML